MWLPSPDSPGRDLSIEPCSQGAQGLPHPLLVRSPGGCVHPVQRGYHPGIPSKAKRSTSKGQGTPSLDLPEPGLLGLQRDSPCGSTAESPGSPQKKPTVESPQDGGGTKASGGVLVNRQVTVTMGVSSEAWSPSATTGH